MFGAIKHGLVNLANFDGRDARQTFWYYVLFVVILRFCAGLAVSIPMMGQAMRVGFSAAQNHADPAAMQGQMFAAIASAMPTMMWLSIAVGVVTGLLLVASLVRRLHDSGHSGWWVLLPIAIHAYVLAQSPAALHRAMAVMQQFSLRDGIASNPAAMMQAQGTMALLGWVPAILIIIAGVLGSTDGPNRFGDEPVRF